MTQLFFMTYIPCAIIVELRVHQASHIINQIVPFLFVQALSCYTQQKSGETLQRYTQDSMFHTTLPSSRKVAKPVFCKALAILR